MHRIWIVFVLLLLGLPSAGAHSFSSHAIAVDMARLQQRLDALCNEPKLAQALRHWCQRQHNPIADDDGNGIIDPPEETVEPDPPFTPPPEVLAEEAHVLSLVNQIRRAQGIREVTHNAALHRAARLHSEDMADRGFISHTGSNGSHPGQRIREQGYLYRTFGENVASGQRTPESVMNAWMNSPGHRANILQPGFCELGVGLAYRNSTPYWTQKFACR